MRRVAGVARKGTRPGSVPGRPLTRAPRPTPHTPRRRRRRRRRRAREAGTFARMDGQLAHLCFLGEISAKSSQWTGEWTGEWTGACAAPVAVVEMRMRVSDHPRTRQAAGNSRRGIRSIPAHDSWHGVRTSRRPCQAVAQFRETGDRGPGGHISRDVNQNCAADGDHSIRDTTDRRQMALTSPR